VEAVKDASKDTRRANGIRHYCQRRPIRSQPRPWATKPRVDVEAPCWPVYGIRENVHRHPIAGSRRTSSIAGQPLEEVFEILYEATRNAPRRRTPPNGTGRTEAKKTLRAICEGRADQVSTGGSRGWPRLMFASRESSSAGKDVVRRQR